LNLEEFRKTRRLSSAWQPLCLSVPGVFRCQRCREWENAQPREDKAGIAKAYAPPATVSPGDWLQSLTSAERKENAFYRGLFAYFPDALAAVARHSVRSNEKHNPGTEPHWAREKSKDHLDCIARHLAGVGGFDEGQRHSVGLAWRALANLQLEIEGAMARGEKV